VRFGPLQRTRQTGPVAIRATIPDRYLLAMHPGDGCRLGYRDLEAIQTHRLRPPQVRFNESPGLPDLVARVSLVARVDRSVVNLALPARKVPAAEELLDFLLLDFHPLLVHRQKTSVLCFNRSPRWIPMRFWRSSRKNSKPGTSKCPIRATAPRSPLGLLEHSTMPSRRWTLARSPRKIKPPEPLRSSYPSYRLSEVLFLEPLMVANVR